MTQSTSHRAVAADNRDARFHAVAQSVVSQVLAERRPIDPDTAERDVHDIAVEVAVLLLQRVFEEDAELRAARFERDQWKAIAEQAVKFRPHVFTLPIDPAGQAG